VVRVKHLDEEATPEQHFGAMVRAAREARDWTQETLRRHLAERGVLLEKTAMIRLEQGKRPIRLNEVSVLANLLGLDLQAYAGMGPQLTSAKEYEDALAEDQRIREEIQQLEAELERLRSEHTAAEGAIRTRLMALRHSATEIATALFIYDRDHLNGHR
jgi:transcriptional regulator with XRE-family HTH domain